MSRAAELNWTPLPQSWQEEALCMPGSILLESSLARTDEHCSYLFTKPERILTAHHPQDLPHLFAGIEQALAQGHHVAGYFAYEAGSHFLGLPPQFTTGEPVAVFGVYRSPRIFNHRADRTSDSNESSPIPLQIAPFLTETKADYTSRVAQVKEWIAAGETYQLNLTTRAESPCPHSAATVYEALRHQQPCSYGAIVNLTSAETILSFSPELFFRADASGTITTRPMKGTAQLSNDPSENEEAARQLQNDEKNRAEHVMIVDLLRNDLGRICRTGTVRVDDLFSIEQYRSLLQMTSTIRGNLQPDITWYQVFRALFPCGSITGAPKRRTMQRIQQMENTPRGIYTGAIGHFAPDRTATFNVAIRTAVLRDNQLTIGVGGGIVADSTAEAEHAECLLKLAFVRRAAEPISLIETMLWSNGRIPLLDLHLQRLARSAADLGYPFHEAQIREAIHTASISWTEPKLRIRLLLSQEGTTTLQAEPGVEWPAHLRLCIAGEIQPGPHLRHKTTYRPQYNAGLTHARSNGFDEAIFLNPAGELTEGCISTLLLRIRGQWLTPPLAAGILPGVYRSLLLEQDLIREAPLTEAHLHQAEHVCICNAVRGTGCVTSLQLSTGDTLRWQPAPDAPATW